MQIEAKMREQIMRGELAPASRLRMDDLKRRFEVGYSPIREALSRLIGEGLVELEHNKGFRVAGLSREDLEDIAIARIAVETAAFRHAIERGDDDWEARVIAAMHRYRRRSETLFDSDADFSAWEQVHDELHTALISACGSPRLLAQQKLLQCQHQRYRRLIVVPAVAADAHIDEHQQLVDLALERNADLAVRHIDKHMRITLDALKNTPFLEKDA